MIQKSKSAKAPKAQPPHQRGAVPGPLAASPNNKPVDAVLLVTQLEASPTNPRKHFDDEALAELATTIRQHGILEPILVRRQADCVSGRGRDLYEIVAGERRYRAAKLAKLKEVPCRIATLTDAEVLEIQVVENLARSDLNAIEEAIGFKQLLDTGLTQEQLAEKIGKTQAHVSNRVRLLELPAAWRELVIAGRLPTSHARDLLGFTKSPPLAIAALTKFFKDCEKEGFPPLRQWLDQCEYSLRHASEPLTGQEYVNGQWAHWKIKPTTEQREQLQLVEIKEWNGKPRSFAFNKQLHSQLKKAAIAEALANNKKGAKAPAKGKQAEPTAAQKRASAKEKAEQFAKRLYAWKIDWLRRILDRKLAAEGTKQSNGPLCMRLLLYLMTSDESGAFGGTFNRRAEAFELAFEQTGHKLGEGERFGIADFWNALNQVPDTKLTELAVALIRSMLVMPSEQPEEEPPMPNGELPPQRIEQLAEKLHVRLGNEWHEWHGDECIRDYYELHTKDQLVELTKATQAGQQQFANTGSTKSALVEYLVSSQRPLPQEIVDAKAPKR